MRKILYPPEPQHENRFKLGRATHGPSRKERTHVTTTPTRSSRRKRPTSEQAPPPPRPGLLAPVTAPPPGIAERVYQHVCRLAAEQGMPVREVDPPFSSMCLTDVDDPRLGVRNQRAVGLRVLRTLHPLDKAWRVASHVGELACFKPGYYTWQWFPMEAGEGDEQDFEAAERFASSLVASLTAAELVKGGAL